ncbi:LLM class flavin-dependent oxidoreductase [Auritidibacter ignavus]|uniref:LLM class flavin-dependent oxidoreductase n=1 Tax=Auritidibacter ignavus TaxID=678932 RepID=UPI0021068224|nr:LLM class flavin-dependent oxidoreductase [Auritidibacter ignavus]
MLRYENPLYFAEEAATTDLISDARLHLGISRGSPEAALDGQHQFGYHRDQGQSWSDYARNTGGRIRQAISGEPIAHADPDSSWAPVGVDRLRIEPYSSTLINRLYWGAGSTSSAVWAGEQGYNLVSSTLLLEDDGRPFHIQQAHQLTEYRAAYTASGHTTGGQTAVTRSIYVIESAEDKLRYAPISGETDSVGMLDGARARSGPTVAGTVDSVAEQLAADQAVREADLLLVANPNQWGVVANRRLFASWVRVFEHLGWK